uniref:Ovule protein n=1 Tax=Ascaris lumbricoides TaxID=6252 RepID=A0A0M3IMZ4_ASCLU
MCIALCTFYPHSYILHSFSQYVIMKTVFKKIALEYILMQGNIPSATLPSRSKSILPQV